MGTYTLLICVFLEKVNSIFEIIIDRRFYIKIRMKIRIFIQWFVVVISSPTRFSRRVTEPEDEPIPFSSGILNSIPCSGDF